MPKTQADYVRQFVYLAFALPAQHRVAIEAVQPDMIRFRTDLTEGSRGSVQALPFAVGPILARRLMTFW